MPCFVIVIAASTNIDLVVNRPRRFVAWRTNCFERLGALWPRFARFASRNAIRREMPPVKPETAVFDATARELVLDIAPARAHELSRVNNIAVFTGMCCAALWMWFGLKLSRRTQQIPGHR